MERGWKENGERMAEHGKTLSQEYGNNMGCLFVHVRNPNVYCHTQQAVQQLHNAIKSEKSGSTSRVISRFPIGNRVKVTHVPVLENGVTRPPV